MATKMINYSANKFNKENKTGNLFCFFSGYIKDVLEVLDVKIDNELKTYQITLTAPKAIKIDAANYIQLNGVLCLILNNKENIFTVSTTFELAHNTSLENITKGNKLNFGLLAEEGPNEELGYLIHPSAGTKATLTNISILSGHKHTLKFDFTCLSDQVDIEENKYVGISGASLTIKELTFTENLCQFSIYAGKQTQENTCFNKNMKIGEEVNLSQSKLSF